MYNTPIELLIDLAKPEVIKQSDIDGNIAFGLFQYKRPGTAGSQDYAHEVEGVALASEFERLKQELTPGHEIAVSSRVEMKCSCGDCDWNDCLSYSVHIPMIDFDRDAPHANVSKALADLEKEWKPLFKDFKLHLFSSGHSYHAYATGALLDYSLWKKWLSDLLLVDPANARVRVIDTRWVGFSLGKGWTALRLTANTKSSSEIKGMERMDLPLAHMGQSTEPDAFALFLDSASQIKDSYSQDNYREARGNETVVLPLPFTGIITGITSY